MEIKATFKTLSTAATSFAQANSAWRKQIAYNSLDADDQVLFTDLVSIEEGFSKWGKRPVPADITALRNFVIDGDVLLTKTKDIYSSLWDISKTQEIQAKEVEARKSLKHLSKTMKTVQEQLPAGKPCENNLFLDIMGDLKGGSGLPGLPPVSERDFNLTKNLFCSETVPLPLDDTELKHLTDSWTTVLASFVQNPRSSNDPGDKEANFLKMHFLLEELYDLIADNVTRTSPVIAGSVSLLVRR